MRTSDDLHSKQLTRGSGRGSVLSWTIVVLLLFGLINTAGLLPSKVAKTGMFDSHNLSLRLLAAVPYGLLMCALYYGMKSCKGKWVVLSGVTIVVGMGVLVVAETFFVIGSTDSLVLLFLPVWQCACSMVTLAVAYLLRGGL